MRLETIGIDEVVPDGKNPREDFGDLEALAASFALNALNPGEPVNPIVTVRDGNVYRIVDGERRWRAMRMGGLSECHAVVCDGMDEANALVAMMATDDKRQLTEVERSRGVQQMLLLGIDAHTVERAGRLGRGQAGRVRAGMGLVDAPEQLTIERLAAMAELDEMGELGAAIKVAHAKDKDWQRVYEDAKAGHEADEWARDVTAILESLGIEVVEERPDGMSYVSWCTDEGAIAAKAEETGATAARVDRGRWNRGVSLYGPEGEQEPDPEAEAREKARDALRAKMVHGRLRRMGWYRDSVVEDFPARATKERNPIVLMMLHDIFDREEQYWTSDTPLKLMNEWRDEAGNDPARLQWRGEAAAWLYMSQCRGLNQSYVSELLGIYPPSDQSLGEFRGFLEWLDAFAAAGYVPDETEAEVRALVEACLAGADVGDGDEDGDDDDGDCWDGGDE